MLEPSAESRPEAITPEVQQGLRWTVFRQVVTSIVGAIGVLVYARYITPDSLGAASLALLVYEGLYRLIRVPISHAVVYFQEETDHPSAAFWLLLAFGVPAALIVALAAPWMAQFYESPQAAPLTQVVMIAYLMLSLATVPAAILLKQMRFDLYEGFYTVYQLIAYIGWIVFSVAGWGAWSLILPSMIGSLFWVSATWWATRFRPQLRPSKQAFSDTLRFARNLWGSELLGYLMNRMDNAAVASLGEKALGIYTFGEDNSTFASLGLAGMIAQITLPALARVQSNIEQFQDTYTQLLRLMSAALFPVQAGALVVADLGLRLAFGNQWDEAIPIFRIYMIFQTLVALSLINDAAMSASGRPHIRLRLNLVQFPFFLAATWYGLTVWGGIMGVAAALMIVRSLATAIYLFVTWRLLQLPIRTALGVIFPSILAASLMGIFTYQLRAAFALENETGLLMIILAGVAAYALLLWILDRAAFLQVWETLLRIFLPLGLRTRLAKRFPSIFRV